MRFTSIEITSPFSTNASGPPAAASGEASPTTRPLLTSPESWPSVIAATRSSRPAPSSAKMTADVIAMPGPPMTPRPRSTTTSPGFDVARFDAGERLVARMEDVRLAAELEHALAGAAEPHDAAAGQQAAAHDDDRGPPRQRLVERRDHALVGDRRRREDLAQRLARHGARVEIELPLEPLQHGARAAGGFEVLDVAVAGRLDGREQRHALGVVGERLIDVDVDLALPSRSLADA